MRTGGGVLRSSKALRVVRFTGRGSTVFLLVEETYARHGDVTCEVARIERLQWDLYHGTRGCYYGLSLIAAVAATIAALALAWARNGAVAGLLDGVLDHVRALFGVA
jgi:hypothetical protein